mgnify:CR=1 FL=1
MELLISIRKEDSEHIFMEGFIDGLFLKPLGLTRLTALTGEMGCLETFLSSLFLVNKNNLLSLDKYSFITNNNYYNTFVLNNKEWIKKIYDKYTNFNDINFYLQKTHAILMPKCS